MTERRLVSIRDVDASGCLHGDSKHAVLVFRDGTHWKVFVDHIHGSYGHFCFLRQVNGRDGDGRGQLARVPYESEVFDEAIVDSGYNHRMRLIGFQKSPTLYTKEGEREIRGH